MSSRLRGHSSKRLAAVVVALIALIAPSTPARAAVHATYAKVNNDPSYIQVYVNNIENLETVDADCPGDWKDLVYYMKTYDTSPDLFLVQQLAGPGELKTLVDMMTDQLAGAYAGILAQSSPEQMGSPCGAEKDHQTNAIIYRTGRFDVVSRATWQSDAETSSGGCANNFQDRTRNLRAKLWDKVAKKYVTAASIHWPTGRKDGPPCARENAREANARVAATGGALRIWGGDANITDTSSGDFRDWYAYANGDLGGALGYRDAMYDDCLERSGSTMTCLADNWTIGHNRRIDFLFAKKGNGDMPFTGAEHTVTFNEGDRADEAVTGSDNTDRDYSDHRAVRARIHY